MEEKATHPLRDCFSKQVKLSGKGKDVTQEQRLQRAASYYVSKKKKSMTVTKLSIQQVVVVMFSVLHGPHSMPNPTLTSHLIC